MDQCSITVFHHSPQVLGAENIFLLSNICISHVLHVNNAPWEYNNCWPVSRLHRHTLYNTDRCTNKFAIPNAVGGQKLTKPRSFGSTLFCLGPIFANTPWESMTMKKAQKHSRWAAQAQDSWPPTLLHGELGHICLTFLIIRRQSLMVADDVAHLSSSPSSWPVAHTHTLPITVHGHQNVLLWEKETHLVFWVPRRVLNELNVG